MTTAAELNSAVHTWINSSSEARQAAHWLLDRATNNGQIPKRPSFDPDIPWRNAIADFFSSAYVRLAHQGRKLILQFDQWEQDHLGESGAFLPILAEACGRSLANRRQQRDERVQLIAAVLQRFAADVGLPGCVARRELTKTIEQQGRFWGRSARWDGTRSEVELARYFNLLRFVEELRNDPSRVEKVVHVSRMVAGDTHWLRPANQPWRDVADDVIAFDADLASRLASNIDVADLRTRALADVGIVENLTSVTVLVYGRFALKRGAATYHWPTEAAGQQLPVWLSALHLDGAKVVSDAPICQVLSVENETSFMDRVEQLGDDRSTILVYTKGHANRAVIALLRLIAQGSSGAKFFHEGDLDLPGVRILTSLAQRSGLDIEARYMDAAVHERHEASGIPLTNSECDELQRVLTNNDLRCADLLARILRTQRRVEQEVITANSAP